MKSLACALALLLGSALASPSHASLHSLSATLTVSFAELPPITFSGSHYGDSGGGVLGLGSGLLGMTSWIAVTLSPPFLGVGLVTVPFDSVHNPAATFAPNGAMGLSGSMFFYSSTTSSIPLAPIGGGGNATGMIGPITVSLEGATWMGGTQVFTYMGALLATPISAAATAYDNRTAGGQGTVQLVAPAIVRTIYGNAIFGNAPAFGVLHIIVGPVVPEPGTALLLGLGLAALARGRAIRLRRRRG